MFIDDQSVIRSEFMAGRMNVTDQSFKVLVLPSMKAIRYSTMERAHEFFRNGGIVIACGSLPEASDNNGSSDPKLDSLVRELFGVSADEMKTGKKASVQKSSSGGIGLFADGPGSLQAFGIGGVLSTIGRPGQSAGAITVRSDRGPGVAPQPGAVAVQGRPLPPR